VKRKHKALAKKLKAAKTGKEVEEEEEEEEGGGGGGGEGGIG